MKTFKCLLFSLYIGCQLTAQHAPGIGRIGHSIPSYIPYQTDSAVRVRNLDSLVFSMPSFLRYETDTIVRARNCAYAKQFECADYLLSNYSSRNRDIIALSLHGQVLYWMQDFERSLTAYEKALQLSPPPSVFYLDYARVLYSTNKLTQGASMLNIYRQYDSTNVEAEIMTAYIELWSGKLEPAGKKASRLLQQYPGNEDAQAILTKIRQYTIPYLKIGREFLSDDQPLKGNVFYAEAGVYKSWLFAPTVQAAFYQFRSDKTPWHSAWLQLSNSMQWGMDNRIKVKAGVFTQNSQRKSFTAGAEVSRKIARHFLAQASLERRPYQYTISSLKSVVMENVSSLAITYNRNEKWLGKAGYDLTKYKDKNKMQGAYLWLLKQVVARPKYTVSGGYAFRFSDATYNSFTPVKPIQELVNAQTIENLAGIYDPYFTPENQQIHSAIATGNFILTKKLQFISRVSFGLVARSENPYLWLDTPHGNFEAFRGYAKENFTPVTLVNELRLAASEKCSLAANYTYDKLLYYKSHRGNIEFKYLFSK